MPNPNNPTVGQLERATQNRVVALFQDTLGYDYLGNWEERQDNANIEESYLRPFLTRSGSNDTLINKAIDELKRTTIVSGARLYELNRETYRILRWGAKVREGLGELTTTVHFIDWRNPENNHFALAEEVTIHGNRTKRPDIVLYVNGIALGVIELKRSIVSVSEGIRQNIGNQSEDYIRDFFATIQLVMAGNDTEGLRFATTETREEHFASWKPAEGATESNRLDYHIVELCNKKRFLEVIHDFIVFDSGIKKTCRHNQYFGVKAAQEFVRNHKNGIIWHTQGSGKSLTMVWLAQWILENMHDPRILLLTDRVELDDQIGKVFAGVQKELHKTRSGRDLIETLNSFEKPIFSSLIQKVGRGVEYDETDIEHYANELRRNLPKDFSPKGDIFVFVDECHRSHSGKLHQAMKELLPDATFIGFTGTPLLKIDKRNSIGVFGPYIHTYKYDEAVTDRVVLDLRYEARRIDQDLNSQEKIDAWFDMRTSGLTDYAKAALKRRWGTMQALMSSQDRLEKIVFDINDDFFRKDRLASGRGNAMLVASSIYEACRYYELFRIHTKIQCAVVTSYELDSLKTESREYQIYSQMLGGKKTEAFEKEARELFVNSPGQMQLLIVVYKLLIGFDAPPATYLYIDKQMQNHELFQAICRVNRIHGEDKKYGHIVDYRGLFKKLEDAVTDYTSGAFAEFDPEDVMTLLKDRLAEGRRDLETALETVRALCEPVEPPKKSIQYMQYFCGDVANPYALKETEFRRVKLYKAVSHLIRLFADLSNDLEEAGFSKAEAVSIRQEITHFDQVRREIMLSSGDYIDLRKYEAAMRSLLDRYVTASESESIMAFQELSLIDLIARDGEAALDKLPPSLRDDAEAMAETIVNNVRRRIIDVMPTNPRYYQRMSELLEDLVLRRREADLEFQAYLRGILALSKDVRAPQHSDRYPAEIVTTAQRALFDNLGEDKDVALRLDASIRASLADRWQAHPMKTRKVRIAIAESMPHASDEEIDKILELVRNQKEYEH